MRRHRATALLSSRREGSPTESWRRYGPARRGESQGRVVVLVDASVAVFDAVYWRRMLIDTSFDFRSDAGGKDPDVYSPTLRQHHKFLWSKALPNGRLFDLDDNVLRRILSSSPKQRTRRSWPFPTRTSFVVFPIRESSQNTEFLRTRSRGAFWATNRARSTANSGLRPMVAESRQHVCVTLLIGVGPFAKSVPTGEA